METGDVPDAAVSDGIHVALSPGFPLGSRHRFDKGSEPAELWTVRRRPTGRDPVVTLSRGDVRAHLRQ